MFKHYFEQVEGIEVFPLIALFIFVVFFVLLLVWVMNVRKSYVRSMSNLPLEEDDGYYQEEMEGTLRKESIRKGSIIKKNPVL